MAEAGSKHVEVPEKRIDVGPAALYFFAA